MRRFFVQSIEDNNTVIITGTDAKHIGKVLRLKPGDHIVVITPEGQTHEAVIDEISPTQVKSSVVRVEEKHSEPPLEITLVQGLPKGDKMELIIQKGTELGMAAIWPVQTERSVVRLEGSKAVERRTRWERIALEAAKQCRRQRVPEVKQLQTWQEVLKNLPEHAQGILLWESEDNKALKAVLADLPANRPIYIFIGPEGGFTKEEVAAAQAKGIETVSIGPRILRTETAGLAALAIILYQCGDLGG